MLVNLLEAGERYSPILRLKNCFDSDALKLLEKENSDAESYSRSCCSCFLNCMINSKIHNFDLNIYAVKKGTKSRIINTDHHGSDIRVSHSQI